jgi:hypothetical protein
MPALIPTENKTCPAILRVEGGDLQEICNHFCRILDEFALPPGSIILFSSMSHLHTEGLVNYTGECINVVRRFNSMFKDKCVTIPIAPTPLCGIPDANCVRDLFDLTLWLDSTPGYCLGRYNQVVRDSLALPTGGTVGVTHYPGRIYLPANTCEFTKNRFERQGRTNFPGSIPPLSEISEPALIYTLLTELSSKFKLGLDTEPNLSRRLVLTPAAPTSSGETPALFIGGSNADRLANAAAAVGLIPDTVTEGGWVLNTTSVTTALPQIEAYCLTLPPEAPVIIYCLDNSSFSQADSDGVTSQIAKLDDNRYHVVGELIVAHEITLAAAVANLKRILAVCGDRRVYIITPLLRYLNAACCDEASHCVHLLIPDSAVKLYTDLIRLHKFIEGRLSSFPTCEVIPAGDLLAAKRGATPSEVLSAYSSWGAVHGNGGSYTRMALTLVDKVLRGTFKPQPPQNSAAEGGSKRKRSESTSYPSSGNSSSDASRRHYSLDRKPDFSRGGSRGGPRGGPRGSKSGYQGNRDRYPVYPGSSGGNRYSKHGDRPAGGSSGSRTGGGGGYSSRY